MDGKRWKALRRGPLPLQPRFLVLQLKRIGDLLLTTPALGLLRGRFPEAEITLVTGASAGDLHAALPVSRAVALGGAAAWAAVGGGGHDVCLDFSGTDRSALLSVLSRARLRVAHARFRKRAVRGLAWNVFVDSPVGDRHTADHLCDLLSPLGCAEHGRPIGLDLPEAAGQAACKLLDSAGVSRPYAVVHPGTARAEKFWEAPRWGRIAAHLAERFDVVLTGSSAPAEAAQLAAIAGNCRAVNLGGRTGLLELAAVIKGAAVFCGCDTAAMHLADAFGTPIVALFGPTNPFHWMPRRSASRVLRAGVEPPFHPGQRGGPLAGIAAEAVERAVDGLLAESGAGR